MSDYDPNSTDAMFSRILQRLDTISATTERTEEQAKMTNGRVTALENEKWRQRGLVSGIAGCVTMIGHWISQRLG
jgi:hypothetical protein